MMNILLTGAAGFIASRVAALLLDEGHTVVGIDNLNDAYDVRLKEWRLEQLRSRPGFAFQRLDITDREGLRGLFRAMPAGGGGRGWGPFDAVVNLAARAGVRPSVTNPWIYLEANTTGTLNLLEMCREFAVQKFVLSSTSSLYGAHNPRPFREDADTDRPLSPYAASKKAAEALCYTYHVLHGLDVTVFRYFTVYGPAGRPDMAPFRFTQWICEGRPVQVHGDGQQSRDFTYVDDVARGTLAGLKPLPAREGRPGGYEVINLGSDRPVVLLDFIRLIEERAGRAARLEFGPRHPADVPATWADIGRAEQLLGWQPQVPLAEGVAQLVQWYQDNRAWAHGIDTVRG